MTQVEAAMRYLVKIDPSTIRPNPDYKEDNTRTLAEPKAGHVQVEWVHEDGLTPGMLLDLAQDNRPLVVAGTPLFVTEFKITMDTVAHDNPAAEMALEAGGPMDPDAVKAAWPYGGKVRAWVEESQIEVWEWWMPKFLYEYEPLQVACDHCGSTFDHSYLQEYESDEHYSLTACPVCRAPNCCDITYERLPDA